VLKHLNLSLLHHRIDLGRSTVPPEAAIYSPLFSSTDDNFITRHVIVAPFDGEGRHRGATTVRHICEVKIASIQ
jgi:hypothetical protein